MHGRWGLINEQRLEEMQLLDENNSCESENSTDYESEGEEEYTQPKYDLVSKFYRESWWNQH